jgi:hypothetical protein
MTLQKKDYTEALALINENKGVNYHNRTKIIDCFSKFNPK